MAKLWVMRAVFMVSARAPAGRQPRASRLPKPSASREALAKSSSRKPSAASQLWCAGAFSQLLNGRERGSMDDLLLFLSKA